MAAGMGVGGGRSAAAAAAATAAAAAGGGAGGGAAAGGAGGDLGGGGDLGASARIAALLVATVAFRRACRVHGHRVQSCRVSGHSPSSHSAFQPRPKGNPDPKQLFWLPKT